LSVFYAVAIGAFDSSVLLADETYTLSREASPALFAVTMGTFYNTQTPQLRLFTPNPTGTGAISILFSVFPFGAETQPMIVLSLIFFFLNLFLYCSFFIILGLKYICYPDRWSSLLRNPTASMYAGCFPMGATTLINVAVSVINGKLNYGGKSFLYFIWAMWWLDVFISFVCCWVGVHAMCV
jgi:Voltage-dependent anion channel